MTLRLRTFPASMLFALLVGCSAITGCSTPFEFEDDWLESPSMTDPSLTDPDFRISTRPGLTAADRSKPVIITAHGFTASTFEWEEFHEFTEQDGSVLVSRVLLGGHGRTMAEFKKSTWQEWGRPILDEYEALVSQGYTNISLAGASTGGALILEQISAGRFEQQVPRHFFFIDPIVVPGDKNLTMISVVGPLLGNVPQENITEDERSHWYTNRPQEALNELYKLCKRVRSELQDGFNLPSGSVAKVYKTAYDETADPVSALLIYKGMRRADGVHVDVEMIDSELHVFTRLKGRDPAAVEAVDREHQREAFEEMVSKVKQQPAT